MIAFGSWFEPGQAPGSNFRTLFFYLRLIEKQVKECGHPNQQLAVGHHHTSLSFRFGATKSYHSRWSCFVCHARHWHVGRAARHLIVLRSTETFTSTHHNDHYRRFALIESRSGRVLHAELTLRSLCHRSISTGCSQLVDHWVASNDLVSRSAFKAQFGNASSTAASDYKCRPCIDRNSCCSYLFAKRSRFLVKFKL